jgi:hypothetical protein
LKADDPLQHHLRKLLAICHVATDQDKKGIAQRLEIMKSAPCITTIHREQLNFFGLGISVASLKPPSERQPPRDMKP